MNRIVAVAAALSVGAALAAAGAWAAGDHRMAGGVMQGAPFPMYAQSTPMPGMPMAQGMPMGNWMPMGRGPAAVASAGPTEPGQGAFGAIQEVVRLLEADPNTDWSKVNVDALREHLIDMDEVTLHADAAVEHIPGGIRVAVTGQGRTLAAIRRMVPEDATHLNGLNGWTVTTAALADGVTLTATASDPRQVAIIRGLGFAGVLASGGYHQAHHLMIAKGEPMG
jgi:hypothetical protein